MSRRHRDRQDRPRRLFQSPTSSCLIAHQSIPRSGWKVRNLAIWFRGLFHHLSLPPARADAARPPDTWARNPRLRVFTPWLPCLSATALHFFPVPYPQNRGSEVVHGRLTLLYPKPPVDCGNVVIRNAWAFPMPARLWPTSDPFHFYSVRPSDFNVLEIQSDSHNHSIGQRRKQEHKKR